MPTKKSTVQLKTGKTAVENQEILMHKCFVELEKKMVRVEDRLSSVEAALQEIKETVNKIMEEIYGNGKEGIKFYMTTVKYMLAGMGMISVYFAYVIIQAVIQKFL